MSQKIEQDIARFKRIIRGKIKSHLRKFISTGELIGRHGKDIVSIPLPEIEIPRFVFAENQQSEVGQGEGEGEGEPQEAEGQEGGEQGAGSMAGEHILEAELSLEELADILGEELELPRIEPKGVDQIVTEKVRYSGRSLVGPESLRHFKQTYRRALKRQILAGTYDPAKPLIVPTHEDRVYRSLKRVSAPHSRAVIFYILDVSGSMGGEQKEIVRLAAFWINAWLRKHYPKIDYRFIAHDAVAREVDQESFFKIRESGGTIISSAYKLMLKIIEEEYSPSDWNIYPFQFSDGDNWSGSDTEECIKLLSDKILPAANLFCYGQVESEYGTGQFLNDLLGHFKEEDKLVAAKIPDRDAIIDTLKSFLGKGK